MPRVLVPCDGHLFISGSGRDLRERRTSHRDFFLPYLLPVGRHAFRPRPPHSKREADRRVGGCRGRGGGNYHPGSAAAGHRVTQGLSSGRSERSLTNFTLGK